MKTLTPHDDDLSLQDLDQYLAQPYGLNIATLDGLPPASYMHKGRPRWTCSDLQAWLRQFFEAYAPLAKQFEQYVQFEQQLRPERDAEQHRQHALQRFVEVSTARVLTRRTP